MPVSLLVYNLLLATGLVVLLPLWLVYLLTTPKARIGLRQKLALYPQPLRAGLAARAADRRRLWFHAVSVGEFNAIRPLVLALKDDCEIVISTTTATGQALAQRTFDDLTIFYFPLDLLPCVNRALGCIRPDLLILTETEIWPNLIVQAGQRGVPVFLINGRLSSQSYQGYAMARWLFKPVVRRLTHCFMQAERDADRISALGALPERISVAGNIKFDVNPQVDPAQREALAQLLGFSERDAVLVAASTHSGEDAPLLSAFLTLKKDFPELRLILAPRHPERLNELKHILTGKALGFSIRSQLAPNTPNAQPIVVLDTIGELVAVFSLATIAVMGGSFVERGGQNPLEPISQKIPVVMGPHMFNFPRISRLIIENEAGYQVQTVDELMQAIRELLTQPERYHHMVQRGQQILAANRGAKDLLIQAIRRQLAL